MNKPREIGADLQVILERTRKLLAKEQQRNRDLKKEIEKLRQQLEKKQ